MYRLEQLAYPVVVLQWDGKLNGKVSDGDLERCLAMLQELYEESAKKREKVLLIVEPSPSYEQTQRRRLAEWMDTLTPEQTEAGLAAVLVVPNTFTRGMMTALKWIASPKQMDKSIFCASFNDALDIAAERLRVAGIAVPEELEALRRAPPPTFMASL